MQILPHSKDSNQLSKYLEECRQFLDTNKQDKAIETYKSLLKKYSKIKSPKEWVIVTLNLAKAYRDYASVERKHKSIEKAIGLLKKSLEVSEKNNLIYTWEVEYELGISFDLRIKGFPKKNTEISTKHFEKSLQFIADKTYIEKHEKIAAIKYRISRAYLKQLNLGEKIDLDQTISHLSQAQFFYKKKFSGRLDSKEYLIKVGIIKSLGDAYLAKGDHEIKSLDNSIDFYKQALSFRDYYNNLTEINADTKYNLGIIYSKKKLFSEAIKNLRDAIILYQKVNDQESMPKVYEKLGDILVDQDNLNEAIYSFEKSIEFYPKNKCPEKRASLLLKIGTIYGEQLEVNVFNINQGIKNILYGIKCLQKSAEIYKSFFLTSGYFLSRKNLYKLPRYDIQDKIKLIQFKLVNAFKKLLSLYRSFNYNSGMVYAFIQLGILHKNERQEEAISFFEKALECYREDEKIEKRFYIDAKYNLGEILLNRVVGERKENVESAILHLSDALRNNKYLGIQETGYLKEQLGLAYFYRIKGNRSQNIEKAIFYFLKVLQNRDKESNPAECLKIINHLANAYKVRIKGDKQENIEKAIEYFESVLESDMKTYSSDLQAMTYNNLGMIYTERIKGLREKNLEKSVVYFKKTLLVYTKSRFPQKWARTYNNLGTVYLQRIAGSQEKNIEKAIEYFKRALSVQSKDKFPEQWAMVCCNLGIAFSKRIKGYRKRNLEIAIDYCKKALEIRDKNAFPEKWAATNQYLGSFYRERILGTKEENTQLAIAHFKNALEICQRELFPQKFQAINAFLGDVFFEQQDWLMASNCYQESIEALELLRSQAFDEERRQSIIADSINIYHNLVKSNIETFNYQRALVNSERSRSRRLVDLISSNDLYTQEVLSPKINNLLSKYYELEQELYQLRQEDRETSDMRNCVLRDYSDYVKPLVEDPHKLEEQKQKIWQKIRKEDPLIAQQIQVETISYEEIIKLIPDNETAMLSFYNTGDQTYIFILRSIHKKTNVSLHNSPELSLSKLEEIFDKKWLTLYQKDKENWSTNLTSNLKDISKKLNLDKLVDNYLSGIKELVIIPHLGFHHIPFAALPLNPDFAIATEVSIALDNSRLKIKDSTKVTTNQSLLSQMCLGDLFRIRVIPSFQILKHCAERPSIEHPTYGVVENATEDLKFPALEVKSLKKYHKIAPKNHLKGKNQATVKNYRALLKRVENVHSSHHAASNLSNPQNSALKLGDGYFTLGSLMLNRYPNLNHVFLSCCETNLGKPNLTDDLLTLGTGFLCAGARTVISSLWAVDDLATAIFTSYYYELLGETNKPSLALQKAQQRLRRVTWEQLYQDFPDLKTVIDQQKKEGVRSQGLSAWSQNMTQYPFSAPYYWSGFICQGV